MLTEFILDHPYLTMAAMVAVELVALVLLNWAFAPERRL